MKPSPNMAKMIDDAVPMSPTASVIYELIRDGYVSPGEMERQVMACEAAVQMDRGWSGCNGHLARYANEIAGRLRRCDFHNELMHRERAVDERGEKPRKEDE